MLVDNEQPNIQFNKMGLKLPPVWDKHPEMWFANIKAQL